MATNAKASASASAHRVAARCLRLIGTVLSANPPVVIKTEDERVDAAWLVQLIAIHLDGPPIRERIKTPSLPLEENLDDLI